MSLMEDKGAKLETILIYSKILLKSNSEIYIVKRDSLRLL